MKKYLVILAAAAMLTACNKAADNDSSAPAATEHADAAKTDDHDHGADGAHADHSHADDHGKMIFLGDATAVGVSYKVSAGTINGAEQPVEVVLADNSPKPAAIRVWIGNEAAEGSVKVRADGTGPDYDIHVEQPQPLPTDAKLWVEIENAAGEKGLSSFVLKTS